MLNLAVSEEKYLRADSLYRKLPPPRSDTLQFLLAHAYKTNDAQRKRELLAAYEKSPTFLPAKGAWAAVFAAYDPEPFDRLKNAAMERNQLAREERQRAAFFLSAGLVEQGRMREARKVFGPFDASKQLVGINRLTNVPMYELAREELQALRDQVLALDTTATGDTPRQQIAPHLRLYNLAVLSCRLREYPAAAEYARRLEQLPVQATWKEAMHALSTEVSAQIDIEHGRAAEGLRKLESIHGHAPLELADLLRNNAPQLLWKAEGLYRAGRYDDARRYLENLPVFFGADSPTRAWRLLRLAQISDVQGRHDDARRKYAQFVKLFERADPEMQPIVTQARNRLAELQRQAG
jgi:tetratricopeptide (TPR) repeat protein